MNLVFAEATSAEKEKHRRIEESVIDRLFEDRYII